jgi:hypothetical protein
MSGDVLVLPRRVVRDVQDRLWVIETAVADAQQAVDESASAHACRQVLEQLVAAVGDMVPLWRDPDEAADD